MIEIPEGGFNVLAAQEAKLGRNSEGNRIFMVDTSVLPEGLLKLQELETGLENGDVIIPREVNYLTFTHAIKETKGDEVRVYFVRLDKKFKPETSRCEAPILTVKERLAKMNRSPPNKIANIEGKRTVKRSPSFTRSEEARVVKMCKSHSNNVNGYIHELIMRAVDVYECELQIAEQAIKERDEENASN